MHALRDRGHCRSVRNYCSCRGFQTGSKERLHTQCLTSASAKYLQNPNPSPGLGICAALFLLVAQTTVSAVAAVGYCKFRPVLSETKQTIILVCGVVSW